MNLHQLQVFYAAAQRQSFTKAAADLSLSQPAVSLHVKALERELGTPLFERTGARLRLTSAGEILFQCATSIIHAREEAERTIRALGHGLKGKLVLGANTTGGMYLLPRIIHAFKKKYPGAEVVLHVDSTPQICDRILQNVIDIALVGGPTEDRRLGVDPVCQDELALIVHPAHPFADRDSVSVADLSGEPLILPEHGSRTRQFVERRLREESVTPRVAMQLPGTEAVKKAVEAGLGIAFVSEYAVERESSLGVLRVVPVQGLALVRSMELVYRKNKIFSPVAERFRELAHAYGREVRAGRQAAPAHLAEASARRGEAAGTPGSRASAGYAVTRPCLRAVRAS